MVTKKERPYHSDLPIHPGEVLAEELEARAMTQRSLARAMRRPEQVINEIVHGKKGITAETALQLSEALGISPEFWMNLQTNYALTVARQSPKARRGERAAVGKKSAVRLTSGRPKVAAR